MGSWTQNKTPKEITKTFTENLIRVFGAPRKILNNNGLELQNDKVRRMTERFGIEILSTAADSPWSNGICERMVGMIKDGIKKIKGEEGITWLIAMT